MRFSPLTPAEFRQRVSQAARERAELVERGDANLTVSEAWSEVLDADSALATHYAALSALAASDAYLFFRRHWTKARGGRE